MKRRTDTQATNRFLPSHLMILTVLLSCCLAMTCPATEPAEGEATPKTPETKPDGDDSAPNAQQNPLLQKAVECLKVSKDLKSSDNEDKRKIGSELQKPLTTLIRVLSKPTSAREKRKDFSDIASALLEAGLELQVLDDDTNAEKLIEAGELVRRKAALKGAHFLLRAGFVTLKPYTLMSTTVENEEVFNVECAGEKDYQAFLEFAFRNRRAWKDVELGKGRHLLSDQEFRIGYVFGHGEEATASTIVGSGDVYFEGSASLVGWDVFREEGTGFRGTFSFDVFGALSTEREELEIYGQYGIGPVLTIAVPKLAGGTRRVEGIIGFYYSRMEIPRYLGPDFADGQDLYVAMDRGLPDYTVDTVWALRADLAVPIGESAVATISARLNCDIEGANPWSLWLGLSTDGEALSALFGR